MPSSNPIFRNVNKAIKFLSASLEDLTNLDIKDYRRWIETTALGPLSPRSGKLQRADQAIANFFALRDDLVLLVKQYEKDPIKFNITDLEDKIQELKQSIGVVEQSIYEWKKSKRAQGKSSEREEAVSGFSSLLRSASEFLTELSNRLIKIAPEEIIFVSEILKDIKKLSEEKNESQLRIVLGNASILLTELRKQEKEIKKIPVDKQASARENILQEINHLNTLTSLLENTIKQNQHLIEDKKEVAFDIIAKNTKSPRIQWTANTVKKISDPNNVTESKLSEDNLEDKKNAPNDLKIQLAKVPQKSALKHETKRHAENDTPIIHKKFGK